MNRHAIALPLIAFFAILSALQLAFGLAIAAPAIDLPAGGAVYSALPAATPALTITKSGPPLVASDSPFSYVLTIDNSGTTTATGLIITDRVPANATYLWGGTLVGGVVEWAVPSLGAGDVTTVSFALSTNQTITNDDYAVNADGGHRAVGTTAVVTEIGGDPVLSMGKTAPAGALPGQLITYTLTVTNSGPTAAFGLVIVDQLPTGATYISGGNRFGDLIFWSLGSLSGNGATVSVQFVVTATQTITNSFYQVAAYPNYGDEGDVPVVTVIGYPDLAIAKSGPAYAEAGAPITYTLTVTNSSPVPATNLLITDTLPAGATYLSGGTLVGDEVRWTVPSLAGENHLSVQFAVSAQATITNADYGVSADSGASATGQTPVVTELTPPILAIAKTGPAAVRQGETITYTLVVSNVGSQAAFALVITDTVPAGATYLSGGMLSGGEVVWTVPSLGPGAQVAVQFAVQAQATVVNDDYGVIAAGGFSAPAGNAVITEVRPWQLYLPLSIRR